jgi:hypothetical protein
LESGSGLKLFPGGYKNDFGHLFSTLARSAARRIIWYTVPSFIASVKRSFDASREENI